MPTILLGPCMCTTRQPGSAPMRRRLRRIDLDSGQGGKLRLPDRDDLQVPSALARASKRCRSALWTGELGTSKMSTFTVVEALFLVTWWGAKRVVGRSWRGARTVRWRSKGSWLAVTESCTRAVGGVPSGLIDSGSGPVVVLVHGQPGAASDWEELTGLLSPTDHRVLVPGRPRLGRRSSSSNRPCGERGGPRGSLTEASAGKPGTRPAGHSLGGGVALRAR